MSAGKIGKGVHDRIFDEMMAQVPTKLPTSELLRFYANYLTHGRAVASGLSPDNRIKWEAKRVEINAEVDRRIPIPSA